MSITAIISEYNPFHLGHAYQLSEAKKTSAVIAVMSGSFTQRGDAAILSKYDRAEIAVRCGADLVLELPFPYSSAPAERFGGAGIEIIDRLSCVDTLTFGSETGDVDALKRLSFRLSSEEFQNALASRLKNSRGFAYRTESASVYEEIYAEAFPKGSNDILALSYLSALQKRNSPIIPQAILRKGERYNGEGEGFASATTVRTQIKNKNLDEMKTSVPAECAEMLRTAMENGRLADTEKIFPLFAALVRTRGLSVFEDIYDIPSELAARLLQAAQSAPDFETFLSAVSTKTFSHSRIRRAMLTTLLDVKTADVSLPVYTTVLSANETGREILSRIRKSGKIPIITKPADAAKQGEEIARAFALAARADSIWELLCENQRQGNAMMKEKPRIFSK